MAELAAETGSEGNLKQGTVEQKIDLIEWSRREGVKMASVRASLRSTSDQDCAWAQRHISQASIQNRPDCWPDRFRKPEPQKLGPSPQNRADVDACRWKKLQARAGLEEMSSRQLRDISGTLVCGGGILVLPLA